MNDKEMLKIAQKKRAERAATIHAGYGDDNRGRDRAESDYSGSLDARARMAARMSTNSERAAEAAAEYQAERDRQAAEKARLASMSPYERDIERSKAKKAARLDRWAKMQGWKNYQEYLDDQAAKRNGRY